ncbi:MAG: hypothetical protein P4L84_02760 [Isosphaeraceae bacterium]|nr:hypothetical protein [Isosphaeraceae bacterium]
MDICRTLLCVGLVLLLWNLRFRNIRPVRDFVLWGIRYPFHFVLMGLLILVVWGLAGGDFGMQGLFLDEDPLTQVLAGAAVMLLFAALILHYSVLDSPGRWWNNSLKTLVRILRDLNEVMPPAYPVQRVLRNGFLERFEPADIEAIHRSIHHSAAAGARSAAGPGPLPAELAEMLCGEPFRLLVSPAILLIKGFMLVLLTGVVPAVVIPLFNRDIQAFIERLPWLAGVILGYWLGIILACRTTQWAARSAAWEPFEDRFLRSLRARIGDAQQTASARDGESDAEERRAGRHGEGGEPTSRARGHVWSWMSFLFVFFVIHFVVNVLLPDGLTSRWIDRPEQTYIATPSDAGPTRATPGRWQSIPWGPAGVLLAEAAAAAAIMALYQIMVRRWHADASRWLRPRIRAMAGATAARLFGASPERRAARLIVAGLALLAALVVAGTGFSPRAWAGVLHEGVWGLTFLGAFLICWVAAFRLATLGDARGGGASAAQRAGAVSVLVLLVLLYLAGAGALVVAVLAPSAVFACLAAVVPKEARFGRTGPRCRPVVTAVLLAVTFGSLLGAWLGRGFSVLAALWLGAAVLVLGAWSLRGVARRRPALLYPLTLLLGFVVFAIPYNTLDERWQSAMPAAGSVACMVALVAAAYTVVAFLRPKGSVMAALGVTAALVVMNGNAWFVAPNQFKATFPHMESYYALPVYLDTRDYFRETTPSTVRLRNRGVTGDFDRIEKQGPSQRLATAYFRLLGQHPQTAGGNVLTLLVEDPRGRLRAEAGDEMTLNAEEWFTTQVQGNDCIVLAEEPFFRKIYRWFRYETLQMIRDGIIRGPQHRLSPVGPVQPRTVAGQRPDETPYEPIAGPGDRLGLRLRGLAPSFRAADAQYVLIAMSWSGRVTSVQHSAHLDTYEVEFATPPGAEALDEAQLAIMGGWLERCHLDTLRVARGFEPDRATGGSGPETITAPATRPGDCLVLEDERGESPVPVGVYLATEAGAAGRFPDFASYWPTRENLSRAARETPGRALPAAGARPAAGGLAFTLRPAHDRGVFASLDRDVAMAADRQKEFEVALYNAGRVRPGDRLILFWNGQAHEARGIDVRGSGIFEVRNVASPATPRRDNDRLPPGHCWTTVIRVAGSAKEPYAGRDGGREPLVGEWQALQPLNNTEVLLAWKQLVGGLWTETKPKLVIVTVSGGGIRASVWTSVVLAKLEQTLGADFPYHVRLITGASGGMVGGSYYATSLAPPTARILRGEGADFAMLHGVTSHALVEQMADDQLDAVAGRLVFADLISPFNPYLQRGDRGKTLEQTWVRETGGERASPLARPLQSYAVDERLGWRPSMVYTPMMVEDGRRLLVSNLDLAFATRNVGGLLIEPSSRKIDRPAFQGADLDRSIHNEDEVFSLSAVEFFRLFPEAHDFRVTTGVRMSASFPWVSPAISLPTLPPRRVVDAGYYDNYGVNLAALWLSKMRPWLEANTSGVIVIQIRDHVSQGARTEIDFDRLDGVSPLDRLTWHAERELLTPGLQAISTPLLGLSSARQWTMSFRNDEQVDLLDLLFDDEKDRSFFRTVVFECPVDVSLNWKLSAREKDVLTNGFGRTGADPRAELAQVKDYLIGRDSYEFHKWKLAHRTDPTYRAQLKAKYDAQLRVLGFRDTRRLNLRQSQDLYENVVKNLNRLELLRDWWLEGRREDGATSPR